MDRMEEGIAIAAAFADGSLCVKFLNNARLLPAQQVGVTNKLRLREFVYGGVEQIAKLKNL